MPITAKHRVANRPLAAPETVRALDAATAAAVLANRQVVTARRALKHAEALARVCARRARAAQIAVDQEAQRARAKRERSKAQRPDRRRCRARA